MPSDDILSVTNLSELARLYPRSAMPPCTHQSYPVPVFGPKGLRAGFFFARAEIVEPRAGLKLWPPNYLAFLHAKTGRFEELRSVTSKDFGLKHAQDQPLGGYLTPSERMQADFLGKQARWCQAFDALLPLFADRAVKLERGGMDAIQDFQELLPQVIEAPWLPYYHFLGGEFFAWLNVVQPKTPLTPADLQPSPAAAKATPVPAIAEVALMPVPTGKPAPAPAKPAVPPAAAKPPASPVPSPPAAKPKPKPAPPPPSPAPAGSNFSTVDLPGGAEAVKKHAEEKLKGKKKDK